MPTYNDFSGINLPPQTTVLQNGIKIGLANTGQQPLAQEPLFALGSVITGAPAWGTWYFNEGQVGLAFDEAWDMPGVAHVTYSLLSGSLPAGLSLAAVSGNEARIYGMPVAAGSSTFTLRATNANGTVDKSFTIVISAAPGAATAFIG